MRSTRTSRCAGLRGLTLIDEALPDGTTILKFRRLLERHGRTAPMMNPINTVLSNRGRAAHGWHHGGRHDRARVVRDEEQAAPA